jgi:hypothetical protein
MSESDRAKKIAKAIAALRDKGGRVTPRRIVDAARDPKHVLHSEFNWNDKEAADAHRLDVARHLIRYVTITTVDYNVPIRTPVYVRDTAAAPNEQSYVTLSSIAKQDAEATMLNELQRCESAIMRARGVVSVLNRKHPGIDEKLQAMLEQIVYVREQLQAAE